MLLIADEVLTGFGRCGRMFACELAGVVPDIMCLSKGLTGGFLPMGATVCTSRIHDAFRGADRGLTFYHGHSYTANPLGCAAAIASLRIFETEPVFERIARIERMHRERAESCEKSSRGRGRANHRNGDGRRAARPAMPDTFLSCGRRCTDSYLSRGVLLRPLGNVVYVLPPYVISEEDLRRVHDVIGESLDRVCDRAAAG